MGRCNIVAFMIVYCGKHIVEHGARMCNVWTDTYTGTVLKIHGHGATDTHTNTHHHHIECYTQYNSYFWLVFGVRIVWQCQGAAHQTTRKYSLNRNTQISRQR